MSTRYWQVGGYNPAINLPRGEFDQKKLAKWIAGDSSPLRPRNEDSKDPVELVLGIKYSGSSHLLLTDTQMKALLDYPRERPRGQYTLVQDYESLSPIYFSTAAALANKLSYLRPKGGKQGDNSQANKGYLPGTRSDGGRALFEHCRLLYRILRADIDFPKFSLGNQPWRSSCRICAFAFNCSIDTRVSKQERLEKPMVVDLGFAEATLGDLQYKPDTAVHLTYQRNRYMGLGGQSSEKRRFEYGTSETLHDQQMRERLERLLDINDDSDKPVILLVFDQERALNILRNFGINIANWQKGIRHLFYDDVGSREVKKKEPGNSRYGQRGRHDDYNERLYRSRSRSQSPRRGGDAKPYLQSERPEGSQRDNPPKKSAPVYVIDVQMQYRRMMQTPQASEDIPTVAEHVLSRPKNGWCAGNEAPLLFEVWRSMIAGPPIDDQRTMRQTERPSGGSGQQDQQDPKPPSPPRAQSTGLFDNEEEDDPNDIAAGNGGVGIEVKNADESEESEYSDSDFGQSD